MYDAPVPRLRALRARLPQGWANITTTLPVPVPVPPLPLPLTPTLAFLKDYLAVADHAIVRRCVTQLLRIPHVIY